MQLLLLILLYIINFVEDILKLEEKIKHGFTHHSHFEG